MTEHPVTLYFSLAPDERPTIGSIGRAMVEFEKMAGEAIYLFEPGVEFSLVYEYSEHGSLKIISKLKGLVTQERLIWLAILVSTTLINNAVGHFQGKAMDRVIAEIAGEQSNLTEADIARIVEGVAKAERTESVAAPRREFYRSVEVDPAISGVSAAPRETVSPPTVIVPRSEFAVRSAEPTTSDPQEQPESRKPTSRTELVLVLAPLIESNRQWRFFSNGREFGAKMLHSEFKQQILDGDTDLRLAAGVILDVTLETTQEYRDGLWYDKSYAILHVHGWRQNPQQAEMLLTNPSDSED